MFSRGDRVKSLCGGSAEHERTRLQACFEKLNLELPISNGLRLPDQLILGRVGEAALAPSTQARRRRHRGGRTRDRTLREREWV